MDVPQTTSQQKSKAGSEISALTLNIAAAAADRASAIIRWLLSRTDDVIVLTETSAGRGTQLLVDGLEAHGYEVIRTSSEQDRGALIASRLRVQRQLCAELSVTLPCRVAAIEFADVALVLVGVYVPSRDRSPEKIARKRAFIESLVDGIARLPHWMRRSMVITGDYNVVSRRHDPPLVGYLAYEYQMLDSLTELGFVAGHELHKKRRQPHSWIGRTGKGYLYDYFHFGPELTPFVQSCHYEHQTRELRLSDHAAVVATLRLSAVRRH